ncbi:cell wall metabolism sensor histidine kinase WalK, partial [Staphylococcus pseudintermedius]
FPNSLDKEMIDSVRSNISQIQKQIGIGTEKKYVHFTDTGNTQKVLPKLPNEYSNRNGMLAVRFIDKDQITLASYKQSTPTIITQKANYSSIQKALSLE